MTHARLALACLAALGLGLASTPATLAQDVPDTTQSTAGAVEVTEEKIRAFAAATLAMQDIAARGAAQLEAAQTQEERDAIAAQTQADLVRLVEEAPGISREEYNAISIAARRDRDLAAVVDAALLAALD